MTSIEKIEKQINDHWQREGTAPDDIALPYDEFQALVSECRSQMSPWNSNFNYAPTGRYALHYRGVNIRPIRDPEVHHETRP